MADNYRIVAASVATQLRGDGTTEDVQQATAQLVPSGVSFPVRVPLAGWSPEAVAAAAQPLADALTELAARPHVAAISVIQDVNAANQLEDIARVTVVSSNGQLSTQVTEPLASVVGGAMDAEIDAAAAQLDGLAAV